VTCVWPGTGTSMYHGDRQALDGNKVATSFMVMPAR
jgi:hypothetical protein